MSAFPQPTTHNSGHDVLDEIADCWLANPHCSTNCWLPRDSLRLKDGGKIVLQKPYVILLQ
jgi:hypothetical protein